MKLRVKIKDLNVTLPLDVDETEATVQHVKQQLTSELRQRIGTNIAQCGLSLNACDRLPEGSRLSELGVVAGDLLHVLGAQFDPPLTQQPQTTTRTAQPTDNGRAGGQHQTGETTGPSQAAESPRESQQEETEPEVETGPEEPLLVRDSTADAVPRLLSWLVQQTPPACPEDLLAVALHVLMLEAGLQPTDVGSGGQGAPGGGLGSEAPDPVPASSTDRPAGYFTGAPAERRWALPDGWKRPGLYRINYALYFNPELSVALSVVPMGNVTVVHALPSTERSILTVKLRTRDYIAVTNSDETPKRFTNLRQLSNTFKNYITVPLLVRLQRSVGLVSPHEWRALPIELQTDILRRLSVRDLLRMRCTSREMRSRVDDPLLWKHLVWRDFRTRRAHLSSLGPDADWKQCYITLYRERQALKRRSFGPPPVILPVPPSWPGFHTGPAPMVPPIAGILGGEYDRLPSLGFQPPLALPKTRLDQLLPGAERRFRGQPAANLFFSGGGFI